MDNDFNLFQLHLPKQRELFKKSRLVDWNEVDRITIRKAARFELFLIFLVQIATNGTFRYQQQHIVTGFTFETICVQLLVTYHD